MVEGIHIFWRWSFFIFKIIRQKTAAPKGDKNKPYGGRVPCGRTYGNLWSWRTYYCQSKRFPMTNYSSLSGQSVLDVCMNTYGSFDLIVKLMMDSDFDNINAIPYGGQQFTYDETLVANQPVTSSANVNNTIYSTLQTNRGNILSTITDNGGVSNVLPTSPYIPPNSNNPNVKYYEQTAEVQFASNADGTASIPLSELIDASIVEMNIEGLPVKDAQYGFNASSGTITLSGGRVVDAGQTLFIIYTKIINS